MDKMLTFKVREQDRGNLGGVAVITGGQCLCIPALMVGSMLGEGLPLAGLAFCTVTGGLILLLCACFVGKRSSASGLPSIVICAEGLGIRGARFIPALLITITGVGWFGVQAAIYGASFSAMAADVLGVSFPVRGVTIFWGLVMGFSAMYGYQALRRFYYIMTPVLFLVLIFALIHTLFLSGAGSAALLAWRPVKPLSYVTAVSLVVGAWAMGAFTIGDYCRYARKSRDAVLGISAGIIIMLAAILSGAIFRVVTGNADITVILNAMGYPAMSLVFLVLSNWAINVTNAYSGGIALSVLLNLGEKRQKAGIAFTGITGTVLGAAGILSRFTDFLSLLSSFVPPLIGVLIGVKIVSVLSRGRKAGDNPVILSAEGDISMRPGFHIPGLAAYALGVSTAWITTLAIPFFIPPLNGIITAALVYIMLEKLFLPAVSR